jgi:hypothetical protein
MLLLAAPAAHAQDTVTNTRKINWDDSTWTHTLHDADVVVKVRVNTHYYMTFQGLFTCDVLEVMKGSFEDKKLDFDIGMMESSAERYEKRFRAIDNYEVPFTVYIGLLKAGPKDPSEIGDKKGHQRYEFFMSSKLYNK